LARFSHQEKGCLPGISPGPPPPRPSFWPKGSSMLTGVGQVCHGYMRGINMDIETTKYAPSFCIAQINSPKKIKFWKEKAFEDGITLGPTAQATLVCL